MRKRLSGPLCKLSDGFRQFLLGWDVLGFGCTSERFGHPRSAFSHRLVTASKSFIAAIGNGDGLVLTRSAAADGPQSVFEMFRRNVVVPCGKQTASGSNITHLSENALPSLTPVLPSPPVLAVSSRSHPGGPVLKSTRCHHLSDVLPKILDSSPSCCNVVASLREYSGPNIWKQ